MRRRASSCTTKCMPTWIATAWYERGFPCVVLVNTQVVTLACVLVGATSPSISACLLQPSRTVLNSLVRRSP